jgi:hypothetical protein
MKHGPQTSNGKDGTRSIISNTTTTMCPAIAAPTQPGKIKTTTHQQTNQHLHNLFKHQQYQLQQPQPIHNNKQHRYHKHNKQTPRIAALLTHINHNTNHHLSGTTTTTNQLTHLSSMHNHHLQLKPGYRIHGNGGPGDATTLQQPIAPAINNVTTSTPTSSTKCQTTHFDACTIVPTTTNTTEGNITAKHISTLPNPAAQQQQPPHRLFQHT